MHQRWPQTLQQLETYIRQEWDQISTLTLQKLDAQTYSNCFENEWMNEWCIYIALYCTLYTQRALQTCVWGLSLTTTSVQHPLGWCDSCHRTTAPVRSPHTSYRWRGESHRANQVDGIIRRPWLTRASGGNLARTPGLHPTLYEKCHGIFNDHRESGPRFNVSSERRCSFTV